jgi:beta-ureidopropionase
MIKPFMAVALQSGFPIIRKREEIKKISIPHIGRAFRVVFPNGSLELPIRLVALPEAVLEGWTAEGTYEHTRFCREVAVEIPGEETELLGELAKEYNVYIMACVKAIDPDIIKDRYFNTAFLLNPEGKVILKHYKLQTIPYSGSTTPHDVWDAYTAKYGDGIDAFFQVADTDIGRIGLTVCMEGSFPEIYRAYGLQGAEIVYRPSYPEPYVSGPGVDWWEIQNRSHSLDNNFYSICPNSAPPYQGDVYPICGGHSMIVDYRGQVLSRTKYNGEGFASAKVNIEELRDHRDRAAFGNWIPFIRTELYRKIYERAIFPKNLYMKKPPPYGTRPEREGPMRESIRRLQEDGMFQRPSI